MRFSQPGLYHVYNRGINKQPIFFNPEHYLHFKSLCQKYIVSRSQIIAWCLMPNHFHFLIYTDKKSLEPIIWGGNEMPAITNGFQLLQSSYAKHINKNENRTGSLFQQNTKSKCIEDHKHGLTAFWYIHQNPVKALLAETMSDWEYSSYPDYCGIRGDTLCNVVLGKTILNLNETDLGIVSGIELGEEDIDGIF